MQDASAPNTNKMNNRIVIDPKICHGKPVIGGTRRAVALVVGSWAGSMTFDELQQEHDLTLEDIRAALKFTSELIEKEEFHPLSAGPSINSGLSM